MAGESVHPQLRRALLGIRREDVEALQARLAQTESDLATVRAENDGLTTDLNTANLALGETAGWSERLPVALGDLTNLAAGKPTDEDTKAHLAAAVLALAGEHLLAKVDVSIGEPAGELYRDTSFNENGRPIRTIARLGACSVDCTWQPAVNAGPDTAEIIEGLCAAVVCSLPVSLRRVWRATRSPSSVTSVPSRATWRCGIVCSNPASWSPCPSMSRARLRTASCSGVLRGARASRMSPRSWIASRVLMGVRPTTSLIVSFACSSTLRTSSRRGSWPRLHWRTTTA